MTAAVAEPVCRKTVPIRGQSAPVQEWSELRNPLGCLGLPRLTPRGTPRAPLKAMNQHVSNPISSFRRLLVPAVLGLVLSAGVAEAQRGRGRSGSSQSEQSRRDTEVPRGYAPPAGMCRIWIKGVPAGKQPAPTDCASAVRNRPANARVLFGDDPKRKRGKSNKTSRATDGLIDLITRGTQR